MIRQYLVQYNKENKIFDANDLPLWELTHLSLSYKNIIEIDNTMGLEKLTKLQLDNNIICKIQNLDHLVNLQWLDLSFNLITKIEGLNTLTKLTDLSLYSNKITELSGLENLHQLNVFSFGKNLIKEFRAPIDYLKRLKNKLEVLKMAENPFIKVGGSGDQDYKLFTINALQNLKYLDYELINAQQREAAKQKYNDEDLDKDGGHENKEENKDVDLELVAAKIDSTHKLIERIQDESEDAGKLKILAKYNDSWSLFEQAVDEQT